jgi:peptide-methionine (S)-S-oxide reductase
VHTTAVGYAAGFTLNPTYKEVCTGRTGHTEAVLVVYHPDQLAFADLLKVFWESHNPTQGMRQGNDRGTQYRSGIYVFDEEHQQLADLSRSMYGNLLSSSGFPSITTEIQRDAPFFYAEEYHQQYLLRTEPEGYCPIHGLEASGFPGFPVQEFIEPASLKSST